jgi:hypothetical protein
MAVNSSRSMNADLREGTTDGRYRKPRPDTTLDDPRNAEGVQHTARERASLHPFYGYGYINSEAPDKVTHTRM